MKNKRILLIDDDIDIVNMLQPQFEKVGITIDSACNKESGVEAAKIINPDLILLDVMMTTKYEGFETRKALLDDKGLAKIPVFIMTSMDVINTDLKSVQEEIRHFRTNPEYQELQVIVLNDKNTGKVVVDYLSEDGKSIWFEVNGFLKKPVNPTEVVEKMKSVN